jgi:hypothetical protein
LGEGDGCWGVVCCLGESKEFCLCLQLSHTSEANYRPSSSMLAVPCPSRPSSTPLRPRPLLPPPFLLCVLFRLSFNPLLPPRIHFIPRSLLLPLLHLSLLLRSFLLLRPERASATKVVRPPPSTSMVRRRSSVASRTPHPRRPLETAQSRRNFRPSLPPLFLPR